MRRRSSRRRIALCAAVLFLAPPVRSDDAVRLHIIVVSSREKAERIQASLASGADFAALAEKESHDATARYGGDLGEVRPSTLHAPLRDALSGLAPGVISNIVPVPTGYAIVKWVAPATAEPVAPAISSVSEEPPFAADAVARQLPDTAGLVEVEMTFQSIPRSSGWNRDPKAICDVHQTVVPRLTERVEGALASTAAGPPTEETMQYRYILAVLASYQGNMDRAVEQWQQTYRFIAAHKPEALLFIEEVMGTAHLHKAEMDNDVYRRPGERCLFPPRLDRPYPRFAKTDDLDKAIQYFASGLEKKPDDLVLKWLLNLAYMMKGEYPHGVPRSSLIPRAPFECQETAGRFEDVAPAAGIDAVFMSGGILVEDFENDGFLDVVTGSYDACEHLLYFHNNGDGTFSDRSIASGLAQVAGAANVTHVDFDNDGCLDILAMRGGWQLPMPLALLQGHCDGTFTEVTRMAGLTDPLFTTQTAVWADIDNDGRLDLFVGNENGPSQLFRNKGDGTFENISSAAGVDRTAFTKGVVAGDYDNDGYPDFYVSNIRGSGNFLYHNNRDGTFTEVARRAGVEKSWASFGTWFFDYDNDGWLDLFVASDYASVEETMRTYLRQPNAAGPLKLYKNARNGTFEDVTKAVALDKVFMPMGANFGDVDNDGFLDIYLGTGAPNYGALAPNVLLRNKEAKTFADVTACTATGELHKTHGISFADMENDGNEDIVAAIGGAVPGDAHALRLFRNPGNGNSWINVKLVGVKTNRAGMGARIKLTVAGRDKRTRTIYKTVDTGGAWGASPLSQHIGLGDAARIVELEVSWPVSGARQTFSNVTTRQFIEITELAADYRKLVRKPYRLGRRTATGGAGR